MKINKLLFFFITLLGITACTTEYVDNGVKPSLDVLQERFLRAELKPTGAKYIGDTFQFQAFLNGVDVTKTTKFKVNGTTIKDNNYIPHRVGSHSVIATMEDFEVNFKFNVIALNEEEPEPISNRIEYDGKSYPVTDSNWAIYVNKDTSLPIIYDNVGVPGKFTLWELRSMDNTSFPMSDNGLSIGVYVPVDKNNIPQNINEVDFQKLHFQNRATVKIEKELKPFNTLDNDFPRLNFISITGQRGNYTIEVQNGIEHAILYWNGPFTLGKIPQ